MYVYVYACIQLTALLGSLFFPEGMAAEAEADEPPDPGPYHCPKCLQVLYFRPDLEEHARLPHDHACPSCQNGRSFVSAEALEEHLTRQHELRDRRCEACGFTCREPREYARHLATHAPLANAERKGPNEVWVRNRRYNRRPPAYQPRSSFRGAAQATYLPVEGIETPLIETALRHLEARIRSVLKSYIDDRGGPIKYTLKAFLTFTKYEYAEGGEPGVTTDLHTLNSNAPYILSNMREFSAQFLENIEVLNTAAQLFSEEGSGFHIESVQGVDVNIWYASPNLLMGDYIPTPLYLLNSPKRFHLINVKTDAHCLKYSILAGLLGRDLCEPDQPDTYDRLDGDLAFDFSRVSAQSSIVDVEHFEADNENVAINIYTLRVQTTEPQSPADAETTDEGLDVDKHFRPEALRCSPKLIKKKPRGDKVEQEEMANLTVVNLLLLHRSSGPDDDQYHLTAVTNFHQFFKRRNHRNEVHVCFRCLQQFTGANQDENWRLHQEGCARHNPDGLALRLPQAGTESAILRFTKTHLQHFSPFVAYIDMEAAMVSEAFATEHRQKVKEAREERVKERETARDPTRYPEKSAPPAPRRKLDAFLCLGEGHGEEEEEEEEARRRAAIEAEEEDDGEEEEDGQDGQDGQARRPRFTKGPCRDYTEAWPGSEAKRHHLMAWSCHIKAPLPKFQRRFKTTTFVGEDAGRNLMAHLKKVKREIDKILRMETVKAPPKLSPSQEKDFRDPTVPCHICEKPVTCTLTGQDYRRHLHSLEGLDKLGPAVRDHDHFSGKLRGKAHYKCNQDYRLPSVYRLPVFAHNLASYDVSRYIYMHVPFSTF